MHFRWFSFEDCAWIKKVTAVERVFPDQVRIRFEYRRPHVAVRCENGYVVVDVTPARMQADFRYVSAVDDPDATIATGASFVVEDRDPGGQEA